jgi:hypothetical protein
MFFCALKQYHRLWVWDWALHRYDLEMRAVQIATLIQVNDLKMTAWMQ